MEERERVASAWPADDGIEEPYTVRPEFAIPEEELCRKCGQKRIDRSKSRNSILCGECREEQTRYPFPKMMVPIVLCAVVLIGVAMVRTPKVLKCYKSYNQAQDQAAAGEIFPVLQNLMEVMEIYPDSVPVAERMLDLSMSYGYYDAAAFVFNEYLAGQEVNNASYAKISGYTKKLERFYNTVDQLERIVASVQAENPRDYPYSEIRERLKGLLTADDCDPALIYYYLATFTENQEQARTYLEKSVEADNRFNEPMVLLGTNKRRSGDLEGARQCYEHVYLRDRHDAGVLRAMGILSMLEGDKEKALELVGNAYEENPELTYVKETLIIAYLENGNREKADEYLNQFQAEGAEFDEEFEDYLSGKVNLHDYYIDMKEGEL